jgi:hypothetical protein
MAGSFNLTTIGSPGLVGVAGRLVVPEGGANASSFANVSLVSSSWPATLASVLHATSNPISDISASNSVNRSLAYGAGENIFAEKISTGVDKEATTKELAFSSVGSARGGGCGCGGCECSGSQDSGLLSALSLGIGLLALAITMNNNNNNNNGKRRKRGKTGSQGVSWHHRL